MKFFPLYSRLMTLCLLPYQQFPFQPLFCFLLMHRVLVGPRSQPGLSSLYTSPMWDSTVCESRTFRSWVSWALIWSLLLTPLWLNSPFLHEQNQDATTYLKKMCWKYKMREYTCGASLALCMEYIKHETHFSSLFCPCLPWKCSASPIAWCGVLFKIITTHFSTWVFQEE